jgi:DNA-directed RNA polymerase subunit beta
MENYKMQFYDYKPSFIGEYFLEIQRKSFLRFLEKGLIYELNKRKIFRNSTGELEIKFYPESFKLHSPEWGRAEALFKGKSYTCGLYVPAQLTKRSSQQIERKWVLLGHIPLMTKRGHFIVNGCPRVIVNQMVRSPGIYYKKTVSPTGKFSYYADLIASRGAWLRLEIDKYEKLWARIKKKPKIPILLLLNCLHYPLEYFSKQIGTYDLLLNLPKKSPYLWSTKEEGLEVLSCLMYSDDLVADKRIKINEGLKFFIRKFMNPRTYDLTQIGRVRLNKKFGLSISEKNTVLTRDDILAAVNYLIKTYENNASFDDIDNLKNRRVRASGELLQNQFVTGIIRLEKTIRIVLKENSTYVSIQHFITTKPLNGALREFFGTDPLSQYMDQTNPLSELTHKRRISFLGLGGVTRESSGMAIRSIHPTYYGRICPIETPEGKNAGLVNSLTSFGKLNKDGFIETPYYLVIDGQVQTKTQPIFFNVENEENLPIAPADAKTSQLDFLPNQKIPIRKTDQFQKIKREKVEFVGVSAIQMISIATSLIPFLEHDDANRALMGSNMQRQAVPLIIPERPFIGTGLESRVVADSGQSLQTTSSGYVSYVSGEKIEVQCNPVFPVLPVRSKDSKTKLFEKSKNSLSGPSCAKQGQKKQEKDRHLFPKPSFPFFGRNKPLCYPKNLPPSVASRTKVDLPVQRKAYLKEEPEHASAHYTDLFYSNLTERNTFPSEAKPTYPVGSKTNFVDIKNSVSSQNYFLQRYQRSNQNTSCRLFIER